MKRLFYLALTLVAAVSCDFFKNTGYTSRDNLFIDFQAAGSTNIFNDPEKEVYAKTFSYASFYFYANQQKQELDGGKTEEVFTGGCMLARLSDTTLVTRKTPISPYSVFAAPQKEGLVPNYFLIYEQNKDPKLNPQTAFSYTYALYGDAIPNTIKVNNTTETVACALGKADGCTVKDGDWLKLTFTGYKTDGKTTTETGKVETYLLDYRDGAKKLVKEWTEVKLDGLGDLDLVSLTLSGNNDSLPQRVCLDDFSVIVSVEM